MRVLHALWRRLPRPLDPLRSIKVKFGVVTVVTGVTAILMVLWGYTLGFRARQTLPVGVLISLVVTQLIAHGMTAPLREMTAAARAMARGDYSRRVRATSRDEVGELAQAFNTMAADLAEVDRQRREFVANVSHELRTPISALHAVLENMADGVTPATPEVLGSALEQTDRLGRLVTQLLDLSRVDAGAAPLDLERLDVAAFVAEVAAAYPGAGIEIDVAPGLHATADRDRLHQVLANLLDNAVRHGPPGAPITVTAAAHRHDLVLEVADEGPGIPPEERARVFERFSRGSRGAADGGTGLGLAIARWVIDLHGGDISVLDSPHGCRIRIVLPGAPA
ncbi:sensor histidine kinase [Actinomadura macrotermitis]|uniref:Signal transduction histidine-protein kinase/phosphatase MprB n=1 Tax=Actinomadura macrotermitis TaxID=2585200 RepID=A0A7K0BWW9_9ACTN|nr:Adaptive-response sensory-kinase SasA [Actinomadura macrotermitis]